MLEGFGINRIAVYVFPQAQKQIPRGILVIP
jgi:hypothetical protein